MKKRVISLVLAMALSMSMFMFVGCKKEGKIYTLEEAYEKGLIGREDVLHVAYFVTGGNYIWKIKENGKEEEVTFETNMKKPLLSDLDDKICLEMRKAFYKRHKEEIDKSYNSIKDMGHGNSMDEPLDMVGSVVDYHGKYNGYYVIRIEYGFLSAVAASVKKQVGDIMWTEGVNYDILIYG